LSPTGIRRLESNVILRSGQWSLFFMWKTFLKPIARIIRKHNVPVAMKPYKTLKSILVHPKDKQEKEDLTECVYKVPCANCDKTYIGETGRKFGVRL